jgi:hypothetical protein
VKFGELMKDIKLSQLLQVGANLAVLFGILLLVYELQQTRTLASTEFLASNTAGYQEIERAMMDPEVASIWVKAATDAASMTPTEIRVMDAWLINAYNYMRNSWRYERLGLAESGSTARDLESDAPFFFGSEFGIVWWQDLKRSHTSPASVEFDEMVDRTLLGASSSSNFDYVRRLQLELARRAEAK